MEIEIFGSRCSKCKKLEKDIKEVVEELSLDATIIKIDDISEMAEKGVMSTPSMAIDGELKIKGSIASKDEIKKIFEKM